MICFKKRLSPEQQRKVEEALADFRKLRLKYYLDDELSSAFDFSGGHAQYLLCDVKAEVVESHLILKVRKHVERSYGSHRDEVMYALLERLSAIQNRYEYSFETSLATAYMFKPRHKRRKINKDYERCRNNFFVLIDLVKGDQVYYF